MIKKQGRLVGLDTQLQSLAPSRLSAGVPGTPEPIIEQIAPGGTGLSPGTDRV
jgi:hypothetical protein